MDSVITIGGVPLGGEHTCIIAEAASNHDGDKEKAKDLIRAAADAGADAVKFQMFKAKHHYSKYTPNFTYLHKHKTSTYDLVQSLELNREWLEDLMVFAKTEGITFLSTACDVEAVDILAGLGAEAFKLSSFDLPDVRLIKHMASYQKPVILSTGMADYTDIEAAVNSCREAGNDQIVLLQCTSLYPAPVSLSNLRAIPTMQAAFGVPVGYSDHTLCDHIPIASVAIGGCMIEKHFTLDKTLPGPDHPFAANPAELKEMVRKVRELETALGNGRKQGPDQREEEMFRKGRRSLHTTKELKSGDIVREEDLCSKRPGFGIPPQFFDVLVGMTVKRTVKEDHWIRWEDFK